MSALLSWGRYPNFPQQANSLYWSEQTARYLANSAQNNETTLAYGNGRSYGDVCLAASNKVLDTHHLDRWIEADWKTGVIIVEAGLTLGEILAVALQKGWFLPVSPGTKFVTVGGAIANDVHGKNHHVRGTFGRYVQRFTLQRSDTPELLICSSYENPALFAATIGGLGLTGIITSAELQLMPVRSSWIDVKQYRFENISDFFQLSLEMDSHHEYSVAWIDCLAKGNSLGRGVYFIGDHSERGSLEYLSKKSLRVPFTPPLSLINSLSLKLFNRLYFQTHKTKDVPQQVYFDSFFYPLDRILQWNKIYGPQGFQQYQCVIPEVNADTAITEILSIIAKSGHGSFLVVLKRCGDIASPGLLSFPLPGISLALDFPQQGGKNEQLFQELDKVVRSCAGRLYPAKDAHMSGEDFRNFYPQWETLDKMRDPVLLSHFWQRVTQ